MKKALFAAAVIGFVMTSCKKEYTCECTSKLNGTVIGTSTVTIKDTKKKAEDACSATATSGSGGMTATTECALK